MALRNFASDNNAGVHPQILAALEAANQGHVIGYGADPYTQRMEQAFEKLLGPNIAVFPVLTGTGANVLSLASQLRPYESAVCTRLSHLYMDECGAPEQFSGIKLIPIQTADGKLTPEQIETELGGRGGEHRTQIRLISITQPTELGTLYSLEEIRAISDLARQHNLLVHMDGARIANAVVALDTDFKTMIRDTGVDILSFGGTKNGLLQGEVVVFMQPERAQSFKFFRKQGMQLFSKMRFISTQLQTYLDSGIWESNARHANQMAEYLAKKIEVFSEIKLWQPVETNALFVELPEFLIAPLQTAFYFYIWEDNIARWMTAFDTQPEDIDAFCSTIETILRQKRDSAS